jgi:AmiR/NasT family two-component response regulator
MRIAVVDRTRAGLLHAVRCELEPEAPQRRQIGRRSGRAPTGQRLVTRGAPYANETMCPLVACSVSAAPTVRATIARTNQPTRRCSGLGRPVVVITGIDDPGLIERSVATGAGAYLTKPLDTRELEAAISLAAARYAELQGLQAEVAQTKQTLEERKIVERAKGLLMKALGLAEPDAFRRLQLAARERNLRLVDVARTIVEQQDILETRPEQRRQIERTEHT